MPLHKACLHRDLREMEQLLASGADVNEPDAYGETPLHYACGQGSLEPRWTLET